MIRTMLDVCSKVDLVKIADLAGVSVFEEAANKGYFISLDYKDGRKEQRELY